MTKPEPENAPKAEPKWKALAQRYAADFDRLDDEAGKRRRAKGKLAQEVENRFRQRGITGVRGNPLDKATILREALGSEWKRPPRREKGTKKSGIPKPKNRESGKTPRNPRRS